MFAFKVSACNIINVRYVKTKLPPLIPPNLKTNIQEFSAPIQAYDGSKAEEINDISHHTFAPIEVQVTRSDDPIFYLQGKSRQKLSRKIVF